MINYRIFVEGESNEQKFLKIFVDKTLSGQEYTVEFIPTRGWTNLHLLLNKFAENTDQGGKNIVIFDADDLVKDSLNGGFLQRSKKIQSDLSSVEYELFLFPNNSNDGDFEVLLEFVINTDHQIVLNCFDGYESCLSGYKDSITGNGIYEAPIRKSRMYAYIDAFPKSGSQKEKMKKGDWLFESESIWNLNSTYLDPLRKFLTSL